MLVKHMTVTDKRGNNKTNKAGKPLLRSAGCVSDTIKNNEKVIGDHYLPQLPIANNHNTQFLQLKKGNKVLTS